MNHSNSSDQSRPAPNSGLLCGLLAVGLIALLGVPSPRSNAEMIPELTRVSGLGQDLVYNARLAERSQEADDRQFAKDFLDGGKLLEFLKAQKHSLREELLLKNFSAKLSLVQLSKAVVLQGRKESKQLLQDVGFDFQTVSALCRSNDRNPEKSANLELQVAAGLIGEANASGTIPLLSSQESSVLFGDGRVQSHSSLLKASLRALAAGCLTDYLASHRRVARNRTPLTLAQSASPL